MKFLYGYSLAAELRPETRYDEVVSALGCHGELVRTPDELKPALERAFASGKPGSNSYIVNKMFKAKYNRDLDDTSARWMQGFFTLADAMNRAGSTDPAKIQAALQATDLKADQLMIGYKGVKFDKTGQNTLASTYLIQLQGKEYVSIWPEDRATNKLEWPMKGWKK